MNNPTSTRLIGVVLAAGLGAAGFARPSAGATPQSPYEGSGAVSGVVMDADTEAPLAGAVVYLRTVSGSVQITTMLTPVSKRTVTDDKGRFVFTKLPAMEFSVQAAKDGYLGAFYGGDPLRAADAAHVVLRDGTWFAKADIPLPRAGVISGTVVDETGEPVIGVYVRLLAQLLLAGRPHLAAGPTTLTDDHGIYRIPGLAPGKYVVAVPSQQTSALGNMPSGGRPAPATIVAPGLQSGPDEFRVALTAHLPIPPPSVDGHGRTYAIAFGPDQTDPDRLASIDLGPGENRTLDVVLRPVPAVRVSGRVDGPPDAFGQLALRLVPAALQELGNGSEAGTALVAPDGRFAFYNVPAGNYVILSRRSMTQFGYLADFQGTRMPPPPGVSSSGRSSSGLDGGPPGSTYGVERIGAPATYWSRTAITIGSDDIPNAEVRLRPLLKITGTMVREDGQPFVGEFASPTAETADTGTVDVNQGQRDPNDASGAFQIEGLTDSQYMLRLSGSTMLRSIAWAGRDYTDRPIDLGAGRDVTNVVITVTDRKTQLAGLVTDLPSGASGRENATVLVFPADPNQRVNVGVAPRRLSSTTPRSDGRYEFNNLPPGRYCVIAVPSRTLGDWRDPRFLNAAAAGAVQVTIEWGSTVQQNLRTETVR